MDVQSLASGFLQWEALDWGFGRRSPISCFCLFPVEAEKSLFLAILVFFHLAFYFWENLVCSKKEGKKEYPICWNSGFQEDILSGDGLFLVCVAFGLKVWTVWREGEVSWIETENGKDMFSLLGGGIARFSMGRYLPCNSLSFWHKLWRSVRFPCSYLLYDIFMSANYRICCYSIVTTGFCTLSSLIVFG